MDKHELAVIRAEEADRILSSQVFGAAFDDVRAALFKTWAELPTGDTENARDIHRRLKCLDQVKRALEEHVKTGKLAAREIEGRSRLAQSVRNAFNLKK
jgi:hypothetical protein